MSTLDPISPLPRSLQPSRSSTLPVVFEEKKDSYSWRGLGGRKPTVRSIEFDRQLDKLAVWMEQWDHDEVCILYVVSSDKNVLCYFLIARLHCSMLTSLATCTKYLTCQRPSAHIWVRHIVQTPFVENI